MRLSQGKEGSDRGRPELSESSARLRSGGDASVERLHAAAGNRAVLDLLDPIKSELQQAGEDLLPGVHIHRGPGAARAAEAANATAFTVGRHVVLGSRVPSLSTAAGRRVLAHELAHVLQQSGAGQPHSLGLMPPGSRAEQQAAAGVASAGGEAGLARIAEKDLTQLSESELWSEYQLAQEYVAQQAPGADYDAGVAYVREIEAAVRARAATPSSPPAAPTAATGEPEESFADVSSSLTGPEAPPLQSGRTPLRSGDIDRYGAFNTQARRGDPYEGHEVLQNAFLKAIGAARRRGTGPASRGNPSLSVDEETHALIDEAQQQLGLRDPNRLATMTDDQVVAANIRALEMAGVEHSQIQVIQREALAHAARVRTSSSAASSLASPAPASPPPSSTPTSGEPNMTSSTGEAVVAPPPAATPEPNMTSATGEAVVAPSAPELNYTPAAPEPNVSTTTPEPAVPAPQATGAPEPNVAREPIVSQEPPSVSTVEGETPMGGRTGGGSASGEPGIGGPIVMNVAAPLVLGVVHDEAVKAIRDSRGYAPVGALAYAHEGFVSRVARVFTGAAVEEQMADLPARMNVTAFRANARAQAAAVPVGGTLLCIFQAPIPQGSVRDVQNLAATYRRGADGRWTLVPYAPVPDDVDTEHVLVGLVMPHVGTTQAAVVTPDMNVILGSASDREVARHLNLPVR